MSQVFMDCATTRNPCMLGSIWNGTNWRRSSRSRIFRTVRNAVNRIASRSKIAPTVAASFSVSIGNLKQLLECSIPKGGGQHSRTARL